MITKEQVPRIVGHPAYDASHQKIGEVAQVYLDTDSGQPEWMSVRTGMFGTKETFVPLGPAELRGDEVLVPFGADKVRHAPKVTPDGGHLPASEEARLYDYYGLQYRPYGQGEQADEAAGERGFEETTAAATTTAPDYQRTSDYQEAADFRETSSLEQDIGARKAPLDQEEMTRSEERLLVGTEWRESGRAKLHKYVVTEEQQQTIPVREERVRVVREPVSEADRERLSSEIGEREQEVVLHSERPVVETETVPVERVRLDKETVTHDETVGRQVRKERIDVEGVEGFAEDEER